ncbi:hypothetical protein GQ42DRAFT_179245 [Ramicandelaber brevisporus]|nr:hypothetical protein GQ42DRAFT_179245 [Ramicandelaber brevisporus]
MRVTKLILQSIDLAAVLPNITHLWLSFFELADAVKSSQGKCFERICFLGIKSFNYKFDKTKPSKTVDSVLNWIDNRLEAEGGLEKVEWDQNFGDDIQLSRHILNWFQRNGLNFSDSKSADFSATITQCLVDWEVGGDEYGCAVKRFGRVLKSIPPSKRQHFTFPILKRLKIGACCAAANKMYSRFSFGKLFPSVQSLVFESNHELCDDDDVNESLSGILAHPWPSVRKLEIYSDFILKESMPYLASMPNIEELTMKQDNSEAGYNDWDLVNLRDLGRALPKLVRLVIDDLKVASAPQKQQKQQQKQQMNLFRHLRYVSLKNLTVNASVIDTLVNAPALVNLRLERVYFENDVEIHHDYDWVHWDKEEEEDEYENRRRFYYDDDDDFPGYHRGESVINLDFLAGVTNATVRSVDIYVNSYRSPVIYANTIRAILRCFVRLAVCTIHTEDRKSFREIPKEFPVAKIKNYYEQPGDLQQQPTLPLLYLPIELAEEISLFFGGRDAAKLLRVSRSFHSLFLPRVWVDLDTFAAIKGDDMKRHMLEKYGHLVRSIDFTENIVSEFKFNWLPFVKRATHLKYSFDYETTTEETEMLMKLIEQSKMLRTLNLHFYDYNASVKFDKLAAAVNGLEYIKRITYRDELNHDEHETYNWKPEYSGYVHAIIPCQRWQCLTDLRIGIVSSSILMDIVNLNPPLQRLAIRTEHSDAPVENDASKCNHDEFQLDTILDRLPHLVDFWIERYTENDKGGHISLELELL